MTELKGKGFTVRVTQEMGCTYISTTGDAPDNVKKVCHELAQKHVSIPMAVSLLKISLKKELI